MFAAVEEQYKISKDLKRSDVKLLKEWLITQKHLPQITELELILFLHSCYYSNEATKICIDNYYTIRAHCPEFFANRNPFSAEIQQNMQTFLLVPMPKATPEGYTVYYHKLLDVNPEKYNNNVILKHFDMMISLDLKQKGIMNGHIIVIDLTGFTLSHMMKVSMVSAKKYMLFLQDALPVRLKGFHYVNAVPFMDKILSLFKPFMKKNLIEMLKIHSGNNETVFDIIPKECLPEEIGGTGGSATDLYEREIQRICDNVAFFEEEEKFIADESLREGKPKNVDEMFGVEGTFKKLDID